LVITRNPGIMDNETFVFVSSHLIRTCVCRNQINWSTSSLLKFEWSSYYRSFVHWRCIHIL